MFPPSSTTVQRGTLPTSTGTAYAGWDELEGERFSAEDGHPSQALSDSLAQRLVDTLRGLAPECK